VWVYYKHNKNQETWDRKQIQVQSTKRSIYINDCQLLNPISRECDHWIIKIALDFCVLSAEIYLLVPDDLFDWIDSSRFSIFGALTQIYLTHTFVWTKKVFAVFRTYLSVMAV